MLHFLLHMLKAPLEHQKHFCLDMLLQKTFFVNINRNTFQIKELFIILKALLHRPFQYHYGI